MAHPIFSEDQDLIRAQLRRFVDERVRPHGPKWEEAGFVPREILREMGDLGVLSLRVPEALGGAGLDARASVVLAEEVGRSSFGGFAITVLVHTDMASPHLVRFGSKRQLEKYLPGIMAGRTVTAVGVTEPGAGSDVAGIRTRAVRDGDAYVLNGAKMFITNGVHGDLYFIAARTDPEAKGSRAITMFIVEKGTPGFRVGRVLDKTGWRSSDTAELVFEDCRVPAENVLGEENRGFYSIMANFQTERLVIGAMAMAEAREALRLTFEHVNQRTAFGKPLWDKQAIRQRLSKRLAGSSWRQRMRSRRTRLFQWMALGAAPAASRQLTSAATPVSLAMPTALLPRWSKRFTPAFTSVCTTSTCAPRHATVSGVSPRGLTLSTSAPAATRQATTAAWPDSHASIRGSLRLTFTIAPTSSSRRTTCACPAMLARTSARSSLALTNAPMDSSHSTVSRWPFPLAAASAASLCARGSAPAAARSAAMCCWPLLQATTNGAPSCSLP